MNINAINNIGVINNNYTNEILGKVSKKDYNNNNLKQIYYSDMLSFRGGVPLTKLVNEYKWFVNNDKIPAINAFLKINAPKESLEALARYILNDDILSTDFFNSITNQLRSNKIFYKELTQKVPDCSEILNTSHPLSPYNIAYNKYLDKRYSEATSVCELLQIRPDWKGEALLNKHQELMHNNSFEMGKVPNSIGEENFETLINYLRSHSQFGFKMYKDIPDLQINGKTFKIESFVDGKSDKNVFTVSANSGKKYIIKIAKPEDRSLDDAFALGTLAKIDTYLTRNNCRNSAHIRYYNHDLNVAIYDFVNHVKVPKTHDVSVAGKKIPDFVDLGMTQNDSVGNNNYFKLDDTQTSLKNSYDFEYGIIHDELVSVDNDHATYMNILAPKINKYHKDLPNAMGGMFF